jgi:8-oxo-dGTP pyrophosphatase MutT (NUDIX family)
LEELNRFKDIVEALGSRFTLPLPGRDAQMKMASLKRVRGGDRYRVPENPRKASVLGLIYPVGDLPHLVLIQRNEYDGVHGGQISLPGGETEPQDHNDVDTALREAWEETGIDPSSVNILGRLTDLYIPPSNFLVTPVLGYSSQRPDFKADPTEVQRIIEADLDQLLSDKTQTTETIKLTGGYTITAPCYRLGSDIIWGATAMIISEMLEMLKD